VTISGRGYRPRRVSLGRSGSLHSAAAMCILGAAVLLPMLVIVYTSLVPFYTVPSAHTLTNLSFGHYRWVLFDAPAVRRAAGNNLIAGIGSSAVVTALGAAIAWQAVRRRTRTGVLLDTAATAPIAVPGVVLGAALLWLYLRVPGPIYGSLALIAIGYVTALLPYSVRTASIASVQMDRELEEASSINGASDLTTLRRIVVPLMAPALFVGFLFALSRTFKILSIPVLLGGPGNEVLPVLIYDLASSGRYPQLSAMGTLLVVGLTLVATIAYRMLTRFGLFGTSENAPDGRSARGSVRDGFERR
jgi:iron(III) transport system permease protein